MKDPSDLKAKIIKLLGDGYPIHMDQRNSFVTKQQKHSAFHAVNFIQTLILNNNPH